VLRHRSLTAVLDARRPSILRSRQAAARPLPRVTTESDWR
jgi:hypothetical protein